MGSILKALLGGGIRKDKALSCCRAVDILGTRESKEGAMFCSYRIRKWRMVGCSSKHRCRCRCRCRWKVQAQALSRSELGFKRWGKNPVDRS